jgi:hypothetical protein
MVARAGVSWHVGARDSVADAGGWSRLQMAYLTLGDNEARRLMEEVAE